MKLYSSQPPQLTLYSKVIQRTNLTPLNASSPGDKPFEVKPPVSQPLKRKRSSPYPTSSANSCTGENNIQLANSKNEKLRNKGIDHFELVDELLHNSMATGAFAQLDTLGAATSDEERAMFGTPKSI
ncbi:hypothetical protein RHGRI_020428 [Rhododendron griersonianum]|uniref:Uncharacterized protein n=1 Tax=Rhododendron griersonianum TaxID=479676 RepID=A0AAV6JJM8_9ERIC|nr:hypothetical protein RHGRI_020428 [Rhododendron griersonianum]